jgi:hypothetical protein
MDPEMDKILARKSAMFERNNEVHRNSLCLSLVKCLLMTLIDRVRRTRFSKNGLQQIQLDTYFLVQLAFDIVGPDDENTIIGFYHEIIESAKACSDDIGLLDPTVPLLRRFGDDVVDHGDNINIPS